MNLLHIYGQELWHFPAHIVGNTEALTALRQAIDDALAGKIGRTESFTNDGEGYTTAIICNDSPLQSDFWMKLAVPYTDEVAVESRCDAAYPHMVFGRKDP